MSHAVASRETVLTVSKDRKGVTPKGCYTFLADGKLPYLALPKSGSVFLLIRLAPGIGTVRGRGLYLHSGTAPGGRGGLEG